MSDRTAALRTLLPLLSALLLTACSESPRESSPPAAGRRGPDAPPSSTPIPAPSPPAGSSAGPDLTWQVPGDWIEETPSSSMRRAQYRVPGQAGDGEMVVFYFGPGQGGDAMANAARWANQFEQPDGSPSTSKMEVWRLEPNGLPVLMIEVAGTYHNQMVGDQSHPGYMLLGAVAEGADANWFFKLTGPEETVRSQKTAFLTLVDSFRAGS